MVWKTAAAMKRMKRRRVSRGPSHLQLGIGHHRYRRGLTVVFQILDSLCHPHSSFALGAKGGSGFGGEPCSLIAIPPNLAFLLLLSSSGKAVQGTCGCLQLYQKTKPRCLRNSCLGLVVLCGSLSQLGLLCFSPRETQSAPLAVPSPPVNRWQ